MIIKSFNGYTVVKFGSEVRWFTSEKDAHEYVKSIEDKFLAF